MVSEKELLARVKEESKTAKEYAREGYFPQARDEAKHAKFFAKQALMKGKGWHNESGYHSLARMTGASGKPKTYYKAGRKLSLPDFALKGKTYVMGGKKSTFLLLKPKEEPSVRKAISWWENELTSDERKKFLKGSWKGASEERHKKLLKLYKKHKREEEEEMMGVEHLAPIQYHEDIFPHN